MNVNKFFAVMMLSAMVLAGCTESQEAEGKRWEREARAQIPQVCSNAVPGISHIIKIDFYANEPHTPGAWKANALIDYANHNGGVDRTNLLIAFQVFGDHILCTPDTFEISKRDWAAYQARLNAISKK